MENGKLFRATLIIMIMTMTMTMTMTTTMAMTVIMTMIMTMIMIVIKNLGFTYKFIARGDRVRHIA